MRTVKTDTINAKKKKKVVDQNFKMV